MSQPISIDCNIGHLIVTRKGPWLRLVASDAGGNAVVYMLPSEVSKLVLALAENCPPHEVRVFE